jgi:uncharacterized repeat protein (TIGR01451 family)
VSVFIYALALDSTSASTLYAGTLTQGIFKSGDSGTSWSAKDVGLGAALPQTRGLLADPLTPSVVHAGTSAGYAYSVDGGSHWIPGNTGALATATRLVNALALTASSKLIAGTDAGLFVLDRSIAAPPPASADLSVSGSANPNPATVGQNLTYTLTVANAGPDAANGVVLSDPLPAGLTFISAVATQGSCTGTSVVNCSLGTLTSGVSATVTITVSPTSVGTPANQAAVTSAVADPNSANNVATIVVTVVAQSGGGDGGTDGGGTVGGGGGGGGCATEGGCAGTLLALAGWLLLTSGRRRRSGVRLDNW